MQHKGVVCEILVFVIVLLLAGQPAAQVEEVTLSAAFVSPSGTRGTLVMTVDVADTAGEPAAPAPEAPIPPAAPVPEPGTLVLVGLGGGRGGPIEKSNREHERLNIRSPANSLALASISGLKYNPFCTSSASTGDTSGSNPASLAARRTPIVPVKGSRSRFQDIFACLYPSCDVTS